MYRGDEDVSAFHNRPEPRVVNLATPQTLAAADEEAMKMPVAGFTSTGIGNLESPPNNAEQNHARGRIAESHVLTGSGTQSNTGILLIAALAVLLILLLK